MDSGRDELRQVLAKAGIGSEVHYPIPLHLQECFSYLGYKPGQFPVAEKAARHTLALPVYPELSESQQHYVVETIARYMGEGG
jgi:dTDP-4-amino-4,6-dideoxygalactose transaminase